MLSKSNGRVFSLIIGDSHIPRRAKKLPEKIERSITSIVKKQGKFDQVFCTGDLVQTVDYTKFLQSVNKKDKILVVQGNMDFYKGVQNPIELKYNFELFSELKIGLIHGHQISPRGDIKGLISYGKKLGVDILISGHTHTESIIQKENILLLNPGSCTGAWSFLSSGVPSFFMIEFNRLSDKSIQIRVHIYREKGEILEENINFLFKNGQFMD